MNIKKSFILIIIAAALVSCNEKPGTPEQKDYTLTGTADTIFDGLVFLKKRESGQFITVDSVMMSGNSFSFTGKTGLPELHYLLLPGYRNYIPFFLEGSDINLNINTSNPDSTLISGSDSHTEYERYLRQERMIMNEIRNVYADLRASKGDKEAEEEMEMTLEALYADMDAMALQYIFSNPASPVAPYIAAKNIYNYEIDDLTTILDTLDQGLNNSVYTQRLRDRVEILKRVAIGQPFIPFVLNDTSGQAVSLGEVSKGKYLLIDFWASWCGPCRKENPNLVKNYRKYNENGFEILGVSLDEDTSAWKQAIRADSLTWLHASDLRGWNSSAGDLYGIISIPSNLLLDPDGIIIARNLRGNDLGIKLHEIFNKE
ncbi:MAG: AhpC/TSA family protein [Bacteroidetes bacterium]|nr:AhpC/TSA family protein [Bacteroidota bacterium]